VCSSDLSEPNDNDKEHHHWGQSESGMADIIERFSYPGQTICDPFCGGGTTGVVAVRMNRLFVGIDCDQEAVATTLKRLAEAASA
jgi:site-specific DNA-methyltransferase (adenine-specific)